MTRLAALAFAAALIAPAAAADWTVDAARSTLSFEVSAQGEPFTTVFKEWSAQISFDPADLSTANATVTINLMSADSGSRERDGMMSSKSWFDAAGASFSAPVGVPAGQAVFQTTTFRQTGETTYEADGMLSMRDASKPVTLPFTLVITGGEAHMTGSVAIDRTQWGVGQGQYAGSDPVATEVKINVDLIATAN
ncbi:MAG: YceI family protein [Micropepsaceae bacterium]